VCNIYSQNAIPSVELKEVTIETIKNIKQKTFGYHKQFAVGINLFQLPKSSELAVKLDCKKRKIILTQIHLNISNSDSSGKFVIVRIRDNDSLNKPNEILYEKKITLPIITSKTFVIEVPNREILLTNNSLFLTLELDAKNKTQYIDISMAKKVNSNALINENTLWRALGSPISTKWNAKFGITILYEN
jgi:hypothetical protein